MIKTVETNSMLHTITAFTYLREKVLRRSLQANIIASVDVPSVIINCWASMDWQILHHHHYVDVSMVAYWLNHNMSYLRVVTRILGLVEAFFIVNNADHNIIYDYTTEIRSLCSKRGNERARAACNAF